MLIGFPINYKTCYAYSNIITRQKTKSKKVVNTLILHAQFIVEKYLDLARLAIRLQKDLLWNRIHYFECNGFKIPIQTSYFEMSGRTKSRLNEINDKCKKNVIRQNITAHFEMKMKLKIFDERIDFYHNGFQKIKQGPDSKLEEYVLEVSTTN
jgi:hypothetical protein